MDLYQILQVAEDATREEIRAAYLMLVQESHPDRRNVAPDLAELASEARFKRIQEAFEILHDPVRRADYDRSRLRPVAHRGGVGVTPMATGHRRDIPMHWLRRTGSSRRSKRRLGRWVLLALLLAMLVVFLSLRPYFWRSFISRAADVVPSPRAVPQASQVPVPPTQAPAEVPHQAIAIEPGEPSPTRDPHHAPVEPDRPEVPTDKSAAAAPSVEASLSTPSWHPLLVNSASLPPVWYPSTEEVVRFEPATYDPALIVQASWQVQDPLSVLTGDAPATSGVPATLAPLPIYTDGHYLRGAPLAHIPGEDDPFSGPLRHRPLTDEMPMPRMTNPPSLGDMAGPSSLAATPLDAVDLGKPVSVPVPGEQVPMPSGSQRQPPLLNTQPHRHKSRATHKWETPPWIAGQNRHVQAPRGNTPLTPRSPGPPRNGPDSMSWDAAGAIRPPTLNEIQQGHTSGRVSPMRVTWTTAPPIVDSPAIGFRSEPIDWRSQSKASPFEFAPPSPVPHVGDSFYDRRDLGPYDSP